VEGGIACRAGTEDRVYDGSVTYERELPLNAMPNYSRGGAREAPSPVAKSNKRRVYDMLGNVAEWTSSARESRGNGTAVLAGAVGTQSAHCRFAPASKWTTRNPGRTEIWVTGWC